MSTEATMTGALPASAEAKKTFAVCFAALVATSFCFILRAFSIDAWGVEFGLSETQKGELAGVGLWPFAISIVLLSLIIDRIGFKMTLWFAAACHLLGLILILQADGYWSLYWGTFVLSLGNGAVEAGINPLIAREFRHDKTTWLNRLHAGWPAGFVLGGILAMMFPAGMGWRYQMALILIPVVTYIVMLLPRQFPPSERVAAGVSYREMLAEAGFVSAFIVAGLMVFELARVFELGDADQVGPHRRADHRLRPVVALAGQAVVHRHGAGDDSARGHRARHGQLDHVDPHACDDRSRRQCGMGAGLRHGDRAGAATVRRPAGAPVLAAGPAGHLGADRGGGIAAARRDPKARRRSSWRPPCTASARRSSGRRRWAWCPSSRRAVAPSR